PGVARAQACVITRSPALTSSARAALTNRVPVMESKITMRGNGVMSVLFSVSFSSLFRSLRRCRLILCPLLEISDLRRSLDGRNLPVARNQHRAGNVALPARIDLEAQPLGVAIAEDPVLGRGQAGVLEHRAGGRTKVGDEIGADRHDVDGGMLLQESAELRQ